jgi:hypothetical protein
MYVENKLADIGVFTSKFELEKEDDTDFYGFEDQSLISGIRGPTTATIDDFTSVNSILI